MVCLDHITSALELLSVAETARRMADNTADMPAESSPGNSRYGMGSNSST